MESSKYSFVPRFLDQLESLLADFSQLREALHENSSVSTRAGLRQKYEVTRESAHRLLRGLTERSQVFAPAGPLAAYRHRNALPASIDRAIAALGAIRTDACDHPERWETSLLERAKTEPRPVGELAAARSQLRFGVADLHPIVRSAAEKLFFNGHYEKAVEEAVKAVNVMVRKKAKLLDDGGRGMMLSVFSLSSPTTGQPRLRLSQLANQSERDEQEGFAFIFAGTQQGIRNPHGHGDGRPLSSAEAFEQICLASLLARAVDRATLATA
jgi:uncharacterized protein (TIGR02391 family)